MDISTQTILILEDLIATNRQRIKSYKTALNNGDIRQSRLLRQYNQVVRITERNNEVLFGELDILTGSNSERPDWEDVTGSNNCNCIELCLQSDENALSVYRDAIRDEKLSPYLREIISDQLDIMLHQHETTLKFYKILQHN